MALFKTDICEYPALHPPVTASQAGVVFTSVGKVVLPDTLAAGDIVLLNRLPAYHEPVDVLLETTDLDAAADIEFSVGIANAAQDDLEASTKFIHESTAARAGGVVRADVEEEGLALAAGTSERYVAMKIDTVAATEKEGTVICKLSYCQNPS